VLWILLDKIDTGAVALNWCNVFEKYILKMGRMKYRDGHVGYLIFMEYFKFKRMNELTC
jgi:hypothetical protein